MTHLAKACLTHEPGRPILSIAATLWSKLSSSSGLWKSDGRPPWGDNRHRNKDDEISHKHGNTLIRMLRKYGQGQTEKNSLEQIPSGLPLKADIARCSRPFICGRQIGSRMQ